MYIYATPYTVIANWILLFQSWIVEMEREKKKHEINFRIIHTQNLNFPFSHMWTVNSEHWSGLENGHFSFAYQMCHHIVDVKTSISIFHRMFHGFSVAYTLAGGAQIDFIYFLLGSGLPSFTYTFPFCIRFESKDRGFEHWTLVVQLDFPAN